MLPHFGGRLAFDSFAQCRLRTFTHERPEGVLLHIHGGAWMAGSPEMMDQLHEVVVDTGRMAVVSVDY